MNDVGTTSMECGVRVEAHEPDHRHDAPREHRVLRLRGARRRRAPPAGATARGRDRGRATPAARGEAPSPGPPGAQGSREGAREAEEAGVGTIVPPVAVAASRWEDGSTSACGRTDAPVSSDLAGARGRLETAEGPIDLFRLDSLAEPATSSRLPNTVLILLENLLRRAGTRDVSDDDVRALAGWPGPARDVAFMPGRVLMQDFTGVPAVVDLAAMRSAAERAGGDPLSIEPLVPVDLVIDHSVQVDLFRTPEAYERNIEFEYRRNAERYSLLRWAQQAFDDVRVVPPGAGICHQVNLEHLGQVVSVRDGVAFPDTLVGTDSHTTMINGLGVLGWGVGGIEAEAAMLGQPMFLPQPVVIGVRTIGALPAGTTATDLVLTLTEMLRAHGVVGKFVEFFGDGLSSLLDRRPRDAVEHVPGVRGHVVVLPGRRRDAALPRVHRPRRSRRPRGALHEGAGAVPARRRPRADVQRGPRPRPLGGRARRWRDRSVPRIAWRCPTCGTRSSARSAIISSPTRRAPRSARSWPRAARRATSALPGEDDVTDRPAGEDDDRARHRGDRRDHELHEHVEPERDARRGSARAQGRRGGARREAVGEDVARAGLARGDRLPRPCRPDAVPRQARASRSSGTGARPASATPAR